PRPRVRRAPGCEPLEGRQLLSGAGVSVHSGTGTAAMPTAIVQKVDAGGFHALAHPTLSPTMLTGLKALEADNQTLQAEIKAKVPLTGAALPAALVTKLEASGVSAGQVAKFQADAKALQTAIQAVDPTLMARINAERQALDKDAPTPTMHFDHIKAATATPKV